MASGSQTFTVANTSGYINIRLDWSSTSNIAGNYSDVTAIATVVRGKYGQNSNSTNDSQTITIDNNVFYSQNSIGGSNNSQKELARATQRVYHNSTGEKTITISFEHDFRLSFSGRWVGKQRFTLEARLDDIPRISDFSVPSDLYLGQNIPITIQPKINNLFDHRIRFLWYDRDDMVIDYIHRDTLMYNWLPPLSYADYVPNATNSWGWLIVETWLNGIKVGDTSKQITLNIPESVKPTLGSVSLTDTNTIAKNILNSATDYIQGKSNIRVTYNNARGSYNATITGYRSEIVSKNQFTDGNNALLGEMYFFGRVTIKSYVIDSRGRESNAIMSNINVLEYFSPTGKFIIERGGSIKDKIIATLSTKIAPLNNKNYLMLKFYTALPNGEYTANKSQTFYNTYEMINQNYQLNGNFPANQSYLVKMEVWDRFSILDNQASATAILTLPTETKPLAIHPNGVMINTVEQKGALNVNGDIYALNKLIQMYAITEKSGESFNKSAGNLNADLLAGEYFHDSNDVNNPARQKGWSTVRVFKGLVLQRFTTLTLKEYLRLYTTSTRTWTSWVQLSDVSSPAPFLQGKGGSFYYVACPDGTNLGDFLKSEKVPIGFSVVRDENYGVWANILVVKESNYWVHGLCARDDRIDAVTVASGVYKGYRGWNLP